MWQLHSNYCYNNILVTTEASGRNVYTDRRPEGEVSIHVTPRSLGSNWFIAIMSIEWRRERSSLEIILHLTLEDAFISIPMKKNPISPISRSNMIVREAKGALWK